MAKSTTFLATDPTGAVHKRVSKTRTYTHCVAYRPSYELNLADAKKTHRQNAVNFAWHAEQAKQSFESFKAKYSWRYTDKTDEQIKPEYDAEVARHVAALCGATCAIEYSNALINERVARIEELKAKGYYDQWIVDSWQGRPDLAPKALASLRNKVTWFWFAETAILPVTVKGA
jgi:hypothetical protein